MSDAPEGVMSGLEYMAASPLPEHGGFPTDVVGVAKGALAHIAALRKELADALAEVGRLTVFKEAYDEICERHNEVMREPCATGRPGEVHCTCVPLLKDALAEQTAEIGRLKGFVREWLKWANSIRPYRLRLQLEQDACSLLGIDPEMTACPIRDKELRAALEPAERGEAE